MEEKNKENIVEENTKERKNNSKNKIIVPVILVIIIVASLVGVLYASSLINETEDKDSKSKNTSTTTTEEIIIDDEATAKNLKIIDSEIFSNLSNSENIEKKYLDYDDFYDDYLDIKFKSNSQSELKGYKFVKVENDKLMWNIDGKWEKDKNIEDKIKFIYVEEDDRMSDIDYPIYIVVTEKNQIYVIASYFLDVDSESATVQYDEITSIKRSDYNKYGYAKKSFNKNIKSYAYKRQYFSCLNHFNRQFFDTDDGEYVLEYDWDFVEDDSVEGKIKIDIAFKTMDEYLKEVDVAQIGLDCDIRENVGLMIKYDGKSNVYNNEGKKINVKYFEIFSGEVDNVYKNQYVIVDRDDNVYSFVVGYGQKLDFDKIGLKPLKSKLASFNDGKITLKDGTVMDGYIRNTYADYE